MKKYLFGTVALLILVFISCKKTSAPASRPFILDIYPDSGAAYLPVTITGLHFDSLASDVSVAFNGTPATVYTANDSLIVVTVPVAATTGKITITINGITVTSVNDFVILPGTWTRKADAPQQSIGEKCCGVAFAIDSAGYVGLGYNGGGYASNLFKYDLATNTWTQKTSLEVAMDFPISFVIDKKAYVGIGYTGSQNDGTNRLYEYDPSTDIWTRKADLPGQHIAYATGFAAGDKGYVALGTIDTSGIQESAALWQYDPSVNTWFQKSSFPGNDIPQQPISFVLDSIAYIGGFSSATSAISLFWQYNPSTDKWTQKNNFPGALLYGASAVNINGHGYFMGGGDENWLYEPISDTWIQQAFFTQRFGGFAFSVGNYGYFGLGLGSGYILNGYTPYVNNDLWQFTPPQ